MRTYERHVTLHRYVHAEAERTARESAHRGVHLAGGKLHIPPVTVASIGVLHTAVSRYLHAGEGDDLWKVSITVAARLAAVDPRSASEAAYQLVDVDSLAAAEDAFEHEIDVDDRVGLLAAS
jgi:type IV secretory pathway TrbD component